MKQFENKFVIDQDVVNGLASYFVTLPYGEVAKFMEYFKNMRPLKDEMEAMKQIEKKEVENEIKEKAIKEKANDGKNTNK